MGLSSVKGSTFAPPAEPTRAAKQQQNPPEPTPEQKAQAQADKPKPPEVINTQGQVTGRLVNTTA